MGRGNALFAERYLAAEGVRHAGGNLGGGHPRRIRYWPVSAILERTVKSDALRLDDVRTLMVDGDTFGVTLLVDMLRGLGLNSLKVVESGKSAATRKILAGPSGFSPTSMPVPARPEPRLYKRRRRGLNARQNIPGGFMPLAANGFSRRSLLKSMAVGAALAAANRALPAFALNTAMHGVFPIAFTPVDANDKLDYDGMISELRFCQKGGVHGLAWPQIASGWTVLTEAERLAGAEAMLSVRHEGKTNVVIGVQSPDIGATARYAAHAERHGADAIICIPPSGISEEKDLLAFYQKVGSFTSLPLFAQSGGAMSVNLLVSMYETIPTFRYVKDEAGNPLERIFELNTRTKGGLRVFSGNGVATMITEMERGFAGHCPFTSLSDVYAAAYDEFHAGHRQRAFELFGAIEAASSMMSQNNIQIMVARGVFRPGTRGRMAPLAPGSTPAGAYMAASTPDEIARVLDTYLKPYLRA